ncbi:MAG: SufD family Fe-S cluster assembly protein [Clostridia bacterium]|nr:SufD family Fe-S cluster assembly protein [Clostridia bacterium]
MELSGLDRDLLKEIADIEAVPTGAYNVRRNGKLAGRHTTANIDIVTKTDRPGIDIIIKSETKGERVDIPVILTETGLDDLVYNDFYVEDGADVVIVAGCGIHNAGGLKSEHDGIHAFHIGKNAKVLYIEKHYGEGEGTGERILNPTTLIEIAEGGSMTMETAQIKGVDSAIRKTDAVLSDGATLIIREKIMTHGKQYAETNFHVALNGKDSGARVISRSIAKDDSRQKYISCIDGNNICTGHTECDAIIMDNGAVTAKPELNANNVEAQLIHEAAIGKIAGEQLIKLMSLGLTEKEAEEKIVNGFLK